MKFEYAVYWPTKSGVGMDTVKSKLPPRLRDSLMSGTQHTDFGIYADAASPENIRALDDHFKIPAKHDFGKMICIEIDKSDIPGFAHYRIEPRILDLDTHFFCDRPLPQCDIEGCPWGAEVPSPVYLKPNLAERIDIAVPWSRPRTLHMRN